MQQFTVPQFIDVEDKIIGALSVRQFSISLSAFLLIALCYKIFDFTLFLLCAVLIIVIFGTFAFIKVNGMPFHFFVLKVNTHLSDNVLFLPMNANGYGLLTAAFSAL